MVAAGAPSASTSACSTWRWLPAETVARCFTVNLVDVAENRTLLRKMLGLESYKPTDCVGTVSEARLAFATCRRRGSAVRSSTTSTSSQWSPRQPTRCSATPAPPRSVRRSRRASAAALGDRLGASRHEQRSPDARDRCRDRYRLADERAGPSPDRAPMNELRSSDADRRSQQPDPAVAGSGLAAERASGRGEGAAVRRRWTGSVPRASTRTRTGSTGRTPIAEIRSGPPWRGSRRVWRRTTPSRWQGA